MLERRGALRDRSRRSRPSTAGSSNSTGMGSRSRSSPSRPPWRADGRPSSPMPITRGSERSSASPKDGSVASSPAARAAPGTPARASPRRRSSQAGRTASELADAGQALFVHPGSAGARRADAPAWWTAVVDYTAQMQAAYAAVDRPGTGRDTRVPVVFTILAGGAAFQLERLRGRGGAEPESPPELLPGHGLVWPRALELCLSTYGVDRTASSGSDAPVMDSRPTSQALDASGDRRGRPIMTKNAQRG